MTGTDLRPHPCADLFPPMDEQTFDAVVADIAKNGQRDPIIVDQFNRIVDGVHRYRACIKLEKAPKIERRTFTDGEATRFSISRNLHRRHLTASQKAAFGADAATRAQGGHQANLPDALSQAEAARLMGVSERAVRSAVKVKRQSPELHEQVKAGAIALHVAEQKVVDRVKGGAGGLKKSKMRPRPTASQGGDEMAAIPSVYAPLFAELDALPDNLIDHPLFQCQADELITLLTEAIKQIERVRKPETADKGSCTS